MASPHDFEDPDSALASINTTSFHGASEDMISLQRPSAAETPLANDSDSSSSTSTPSPTRKPITSRSRAKKARKANHQTQHSKPSLRPAKDILSRIRHDPLLHESDFIIGYVDRHEPEMMEMDVSAWKGGVADFTDEEWIPQHRIMYFRKKGEEGDRRVWDRATRLDRLFGSGVVPVAAVEGVQEDQQPGKDEADVTGEEPEGGGGVQARVEKSS